MEPWQIGLVVVSMLIVGAIVFGVVWDRNKNAARERELTAPPKRDIPGFHPEQVVPAYLSELEAARPREDAPATELADPERDRLRSRIAESPPVAAGWLAPEFITDPPTRWAVLPNARVMVCDEPVTTIRELMPVLERTAMSDHTLVIIAPGFLEEVAKTLAVNHLQHTLPVLAIGSDSPDVRRRVHELTGAEVIDRRDLQAGWIPEERLGHATTWVSDAQQSWVLR
ncbi:hypothetical protein [Granulicoccus phenolivorans]|uniref:hypothetical protein n=1 Tax=Granulicoccus phenolivorans TaxID=266854 RepID=UPI0004048812|nr:hypothetical protein [Granulicoccus phenolivorans]